MEIKFQCETNYFIGRKQTIQTVVEYIKISLMENLIHTDQSQSHREIV